MKTISPPFLSLLVALNVLVPSAQACSVCGCSLSSDWGLQGFSETPGALLSLRYESFDQTDLRSGAHSLDRSALAFPQDGEIQLSTTNRNVWLGLDYVIDAKWAVSAQLPWHDRDHRTIAEGDTAVSTSHARGSGDARVIARYQLKSDLAGRWSLQFGLKLPTGRTDQDFTSGPHEGEPLDRGLQLGTGTTDVLAGLAWFGRPLTNLGGFAQALFDQPLAARDGFTPSPSLTLSGGVRWLNASAFTPQLQVNVRCEGREHGVNSDPDNSGGTVAYLSPGLTAALPPRVSAFAFVQIPVYQHWHGLQLQPHALFITGMNCRW